MFRGDAAQSCFGPEEIRAMRRALEIAERALLSDRTLARRTLAEQRQRLAKTIVARACLGQIDPVMLSAAAISALELTNASTAPGAFRPRGPRLRHATRRGHLHRMG